MNGPAVEIRQLSFRYPQGEVALDGVSLSVARGERVGLIGPNGAGKSSLLLHLNGLLPDKLSGDGSVKILGEVLTPTNASEIRRKVGLLFRDANDQLFCPTVIEDAAFGPLQFGLSEHETQARALDALSRVGAKHLAPRPTHRLSSGEKRRVCLAGLLACEPAVLALDEPTSDLDPRGRRELKQILLDLPVTQILATHDLEMVVELCSRVIVLNKGRIVAEGPTIEILADEKLMLDNGLERPHILSHRHPHR